MPDQENELLRPRDIYGRGGLIPVSRSTFYERFAPLLDWRRLGPKSVAATKKSVMRVIAELPVIERKPVGERPRIVERQRQSPS